MFRSKLRLTLIKFSGTNFQLGNISNNCKLIGLDGQPQPTFGQPKINKEQNGKSIVNGVAIYHAPS